MEFANRLIAARKAKGLSQEALAEALNLSRQAISKWETGESRPDLDNLIGLCKELDLSVEYLCFGAEATACSKEPSRRSTWKYLLWIGTTLLLACATFFLGLLFGGKITDDIPNAEILESLQVVDVSVYKDPDATLRILLNTLPDDLSMDLLITNQIDPEPTYLPCHIDDLHFCAVLSDPEPRCGYQISAVLKLGDAQRVLPLVYLNFDTVYNTFTMVEEWHAE